MTIQLDELIKDFVVVYPDFSVAEVTAAAPDNWTMIVADLPGGGQAIFYLDDLLKAFVQWQNGEVNNSTLARPIQDIPGFLDQYGTKGVDIDGELTYAKAIKMTIGTPRECIVARRAGMIVGLVGQWTTRGGEGIDIGLIEGIRARVDDFSQPATLSGGSAGAEFEMSPPPAAAEEAAPFEPRIINTELLDDDFNKIVDPVTEPLTAGKEYVMSFFVDKEAGTASIASAALVGAAELFKDEEKIVLTFQLESEDFKIDTKVQKLEVARTGKSKKIRFEITPKKDGDALINVVVLKDGAFVQVMTLKFKIGGQAGERLFERETAGRSLAEVDKLRPRDLNLTILETVGGYHLIMSGAVGSMATLPLSKPFLHQMIAQVRKELLEIVYQNVSGVRIYQTRIDIPEAVNQQTLIKLANAGWQLYEKLFFGPGHDAQARRIGEVLRLMARQQKLKIDIFSRDFMLPWGLLYLGDDPDQPEPEMFLGLKHIVEHIPLQQNMEVQDLLVDTSEGFKIALTVNKDIDAQMGQPIIQRQIDYWNGLKQESGKITPAVRSDIFDVMEVLRGETNDQFLYFYCHAISHDLSEDGGPDQSRLVLTGHEELTLAKLRKRKEILPGKPIVFINACESAELSPEFYDGFVPYFVNKGARGVIGTECETPALFAEEFAKRFFGKFLAGNQSLGEIFLDLRRDFYFNHNNVMGLLYALYVDADTALSSPVLTPAA